MKTAKLFRFSQASLERLSNLVNYTGKNQTEILETALEAYYSACFVKPLPEIQQNKPDIQNNFVSESKKNNSKGCQL